MNQMIIENGEQMGITEEQSHYLIRNDYIYWCEECKVYHCPGDVGLLDIKSALADEGMLLAINSGRRQQS